MKIFPFTVLVFSCLIVPAAYGEYDEYSDEELLSDFYGDADMISIATGKAQPISKAPAVATVITAQQIADMGATDIDQVLETVPGLHVSVEPFGYEPVYLFRGIYAQYNPQVLMLINGVPITALFHGDRHLIWGGMPVKAIERIEVIRGPGSAIYGSDAFSGVINIMTKSGADLDGLETGVRHGSFNTKDAWVSWGGDVGAGRLATVLEYHQTEGQDGRIESDAQTIKDREDGTDASLAPGSVNLSRENFDLRLDYGLEQWRFRAGYQRRNDFGNGVGIAEALDPNNRYQSDRINADITYRNENFHPDWDIQAMVSFLDTTQEVERDLVIFPPGAALGGDIYPDGVIGNPEVFERHWRATMDTYYDGFKDHQLRLGIGYYYGDIRKIKETKNFGIDPATGLPLAPGADLVNVSDTPYVFLPEANRKNNYVFVQDIWDIAPDWELTAGIRHDHYSDFGDTTNPRLAIVWSTTQALTSKLLYGEAFRSPSLAQQLEENNPRDIGNPDLSPETLKSLELAFSYRASYSLFFNLNLFRYSWQDIIKFVPDGAGGGQRTAQNAGEQTGTGFELEVDWKITPDISLNTSYSLQSSEDEDTNSTPPQSPAQQFFTSLIWKLPNEWHINYQLNAVMDRERQPEDERGDPDDYILSHLYIRKTSAYGDWQAGLRIRNLFNENAREPSPWSSSTAAIPGDLPLSRRTYLVDISYRFD